MTTEPPAQLDARLIPIAAIDTTGWRPPQTDFLDQLTDAIREAGLLNPITVLTPTADDRFPLVAGRHRLAACERLGWEVVPAIVRSLNEIDVEIAWITENLHRRDLSWLERAEGIARWDELLTARHQRATGGRPRNPVTVTGLWTTPAMAKKLGVSPETVRRQLRVVRTLPQPIRDLVRDVPEVADSFHELEALANITDATLRQEAVEFLLANGEHMLHHGGWIDQAYRAVTERFAPCQTCGERVDRQGWWGHSSQHIWHCPTCGLHSPEDWRDLNQVCGRCGTRRLPLDQSAPPAQPAAPQASPADPRINRPGTTADPNQPFAAQATQASSAISQAPASVQPSSHAVGKQALDLINARADYLLQLNAELLGTQIREANDRPYTEHAKRTIQQLRDWATQLEDELYR